MSNPKRFHSRKALLAAIDDETYLRELAIKMVTDYEAEIGKLKEWFAKNPPESAVTDLLKIQHKAKYDHLKVCKREMEIRRKSIPGFERTLRQLKEALAEYDTVPMPFLKDGSVALQ